MLVALLVSCAWKKSVIDEYPEPSDLAPREGHVDTYFGTEIVDPYHYLEDATDAKTIAWTAQQNEIFEAYSNSIEQVGWMKQRLLSLWAYDDQSVPEPCALDASKQIVWKKNKDQDKWVVYLQQTDISTNETMEKVIVDPNTWDKKETLDEFVPSPDCTLAAFSKAQGGDENPVIQVMDMNSLVLLPDRVSGWRQGEVSWLHDNSGFFYSSWPSPNEVSAEDSYYYHRASFHPLSTAVNNTETKDTIILEDKEVKEHFHSVQVSESGKWLVKTRNSFNSSKVWIQKVESDASDVELMPNMDAEYMVEILGDDVYILTNWNAPNYRVMKTTIANPQREHWQEFIPESKDVIQSFQAIQGHLFVNSLHNAASKIDVYTTTGTLLQTMQLPTVGIASVDGVWEIQKQQPIYVSFASFAYPNTVFTYNIADNTLQEFKKSPIDVDVQAETEQVWYNSKDGTPVSMFIIRPKSAIVSSSSDIGQEPMPFLLTGYGGFNVSITPRFSTLYAVWLEAGGAIAIPNLRGGGEYGQVWHESGMKEKKQNVFDDFIAAAEYLQANQYTTSDKLAIQGGSNGGLLVSAVVTQRPDLFRAVLCDVPLTDMLRYHNFGLANIWSEEYGNSNEEASFAYLRAYSPYHNAQKVDYPAVLVTGSENDARTDPLHARKMMAMLQYQDTDFGSKQPILLHIQKDSGHGGGVGLENKADQIAKHYGFLLEQISVYTPNMIESTPEATTIP